MTIIFNANQQVRIEDAAGHGVGSNVKTACGVYNLTGPLTLNQVIPMVAVPAGARILEVLLSATDLDTSGSPAVTLNVGDGDDPDRYIVGSSVGQAGIAIDRLLSAAGHQHKYVLSDTIDVVVATAPATPALTGSIKLTILYVIE